MRFITTTSLAVLLTALVIAGCGSSDGGEPALDAQGNAAIRADQFAAWQKAAAAAPGLKCTHARMVFPDTGEGVASQDDADKIKSKQTPSFQCVRLPRSAWVFQTKSAEMAKDNSDAEKVASTAPEIKVVDPPSSAPKGASCLKYEKEKRWNCCSSWHNLALMSSSMTSLDEAGELLSGTQKTVETLFAGGGD